VTPVTFVALHVCIGVLALVILTLASYAVGLVHHALFERGRATHDAETSFGAHVGVGLLILFLLVIALVLLFLLGVATVNLHAWLT
jgi:hypothetical protein